MPGPEGGSPFDLIFDYLKRGAAETVNNVLAKCWECGSTVYLATPCIGCGRASCHKHAFFNVDRKVSICDECAAKVDRGYGRPQHGVSREECYDEPPTIDDYPWCVLQIEPTANKDAIRNAFRRLAKLYHPDKVGDNPNAADQFKMIMAARDEALRMIGEE